MSAGYTYFGQFVDHDLTFDTTSSFRNPGLAASNLRSPRFDLDCVYGAGPDDQPYMYATDSAGGRRKGASLVLGLPLAGSPGRRDLLRIGDGSGARAVIGDPRNDENSLVCNIQLAFIAFHNAVVAYLTTTEPTLGERDVFIRARKLVRWTYQRILVEDYLPRIIEPATYMTFVSRLERQGEGAFQLYIPAKRGGIPIEFAGAAYRYGHSMVRTGYKLNPVHVPQKIFTPGAGQDSLLGFGRLPDNHWIEWSRFFPKNNMFRANGERPAQNVNDAPDRLQWAYRIDTALVDPLSVLPDAVANGASLADLNLRRGNLFGLVGGQTVAEALGVAPLDPRYLVMRDARGGAFGYTDIPAPLRSDTPLWFYVLAEAQRDLVDLWRAKNAGAGSAQPLDDDDLRLGLADATGTRTRAPIAQLGPVGGMILLETFFGLLLADSDAFLAIASAEDRAHAEVWFRHFTQEGTLDISMWRLLDYAGLTD
ncbi:MAG: peroxidase family protein [Pseudomonadota bacterium]